VPGLVPIIAEEACGTVAAGAGPASAADRASSAIAASRARLLPAASGPIAMATASGVASALPAPWPRAGRAPRDLLGNVGPKHADCRDRLLQVGQHLLHRVVEGRAAERRLAGQKLVERAAQAVNVGADVHLMAVESLLGRHVVGGAHDLARTGHFAFGDVRLQQGQPRSRILTWPSRVRIKFEGLMSR